MLEPRQRPTTCPSYRRDRLMTNLFPWTVWFPSHHQPDTGNARECCLAHPQQQQFRPMSLQPEIKHGPALMAEFVHHVISCISEAGPAASLTFGQTAPNLTHCVSDGKAIPQVTISILDAAEATVTTGVKMQVCTPAVFLIQVVSCKSTASCSFCRLHFTFVCLQCCTLLLASCLRLGFASLATSAHGSNPGLHSSASLAEWSMTFAK